MTTLINDIKFGMRMLAKSPGFTVVAIISLALSIGATTAIVSVAKIAVFEPLPVSRANQFLEIGTVKKKGWSQGIFLPAFRELNERSDLFAHVAAYGGDSLTLPGDDFPIDIPGNWVSPHFFQLWELSPLLGRTFTPDEGQPGKDDVLVLSHRLWKSRFGGDPGIIGRTVFFRERPMTVVGVMPPHFSFPNANYEYWRPETDPVNTNHAAAYQSGPNLRVIAETQPGAELKQIQAFLDVLTQRQDRFWVSRSHSLHARDLCQKFTAPEVTRTLSLLLAAIVFVLLIAAGNVANLQLARLETRQRELATRAALGAGRARVFRQLLTESLLLAVFGGVAAVGVSGFGLDLLQKFIPSSLPRLKPITLNCGVLGITSVVTLATGILFGLMPALRSWQPNLGKALNQEGLAATRDQKQGRWSRVLIVGQFALVLALLAGAGLMTRSIVGLLQIHPGLDPKYVVRVYPKITDYKNRHWEPGLKSDKVFKATCSFLSDARHRITAIPGVSASGVGTDGGQAEISLTPDSLPVTINRDWVGVEEANPLQVLRVPLKQGRWLNRSDANKSIRCVLVNQTAAKQFWPGESAMGKTFRIKERRKELVYEVVGVVGDTHDMGRQAAPQPTFYQSFLKEISFETGAPFFVVRTASHPVKFYKPIGQALKAAGADLEMPTFYNLHEALWQRMATQRALMLYLSLFAGVGLFLASVGLYGVLSYNVTQRQREIGIRIALGAQIEDVTRLILRQGLTLVIWGSVLGIAAALVTGKALRTYLFGVSSTDPLTLVIGTLLLAGIALFACYIPARRAARIDPMEALRYE